MSQSPVERRIAEAQLTELKHLREAVRAQLDQSEALLVRINQQVQELEEILR